MLELLTVVVVSTGLLPESVLELLGVVGDGVAGCRWCWYEHNDIYFRCLFYFLPWEKGRCRILVLPCINISVTSF